MLLTYLLVFYILGIILFFERNFFIFSAAITALFLIFFKKKTLTIFTALFLILGILTAKFNQNLYFNKENILLNSNSFEGIIYEKYDDYYLLYNANKGYKALLFTKEKMKLNPGEYIEFEGSFESNQNYKRNYYFSKNIVGKIYILGNLKREEKKDIILSNLIKIKYKIINKLLEIDDFGGGFVSALLFGYTNDIEYETKEAFTELGLSHILAVSGFNLGIIYLFLTAILKKTSFYFRKSASILFCLLWAFLSSFEPSIVRAFIMILLLNLARTIKRQSISFINLSFAAIIMLLINPFLIYNMGFILSFAATAGILLLQSPLNKRIKGLKFLKDELSISLAAFLSTIPIIIFLKGYVSLIALPINILISPIIFVITILSFAMTFIYIITTIDLVLYPALFLSRFFIKLINLLSIININLYLKSGLLFLIVLYILIALNTDLLNIKKKSIVNLFLTSLLILLMIFPNNKLRINVLNVGQGDSIFIETPRNRTILIDTGPKISDYIAARDKVIPYIRRRGHNKINLLIISHTHFDHFGGFDYITKHIRVDKILTASVLRNNIEYVNIVKGDKIEVDGVKLDILYPETFVETDEKNENALIFRLTYKDFSMLLPSDADLDDIKTDYLSYDVIQLPHHGSLQSMGIETIKNYSFNSAVISVGKNNFGHPSDAILDYLKDNNIKFYRTDLNGNIQISTDGKKYIVKGDYDDD